MWPVVVVLEGNSVDQSCTEVSHIPFEACQTFELAYPKVCRPSIKVQIEGLARCSNLHGAKVHRVILDIFGRNITDLTRIRQRLFLERMLDGGLTANGAVSPKLTLGMDLAAKGVRAFFGWVESVLAEKMHIGLGARRLVIGVMDDVDPGQVSACHNCVCCSTEEIETVGR